MTAPAATLPPAAGPAPLASTGRGGGEDRFEDWHAFVAGLQIRGMAAQLANNSVFLSWDGKTLALRVDPSCSSMVESLARQRLQEAIEAQLGQAVALALEVAGGETETPAQRRAREQQARQQATEADIANDPLVLAMQDTFDAEIVPDSIRRID